MNEYSQFVYSNKLYKFSDRLMIELKLRIKKIDTTYPILLHDSIEEIKKRCEKFSLL